MQAFSAVHLQHIRNAFAVLSESIGKDRSIEENGKSLELPFQFEIDHNSAQPALVAEVTAPEEDVSAQQLAHLVKTQDKTTQGLQSIAAQLTQLTQVTKQLKLDSDFFASLFSQKTPTENLTTATAETPLAEMTVSSELTIKQEEAAQTCQSYFVNLPWGSEQFAVAATQMREATQSSEIPKIMQLATESALKTAAEAALSSDVVAENLQSFSQVDSEIQLDSQQQTCGDYFQELPWASKTKLVLPAESANPEQTTALDRLFAEESAPADEDLIAALEPEILLDSQTQTCGDYFQALPWATETAIELSAENILPNEDSVQSEEDFFQTLVHEIEVTPPETQDSGSYFQSLPWLAKTSAPTNQSNPDEEEVQKRKAMLGAIFAKKAPISDQDFLQMLEETPQQNSQPNPESKNSFQTFPWG
jgi:hypothetical protein